jgi:hypothetical protein
VTLDGLQISDHVPACRRFADKERHVEGVSEALARLFLKKLFWSAEILEKIVISPDNTSITAAAKGGSGWGAAVGLKGAGVVPASDP